MLGKPGGPFYEKNDSFFNQLNYLSYYYTGVEKLTSNVYNNCEFTVQFTCF